MSDPWAFGWTQIFTLAGLIISVCVSVAGLRTFGKWHREKIGEKRIEIAFEALTIGYESRFVFDAIRNPATFGYEYADMPREGITEEEWNRRGTFYAILKRINENRPYFVKVIQLQPRVMAAFGPETDAIFKKLNEARAHVTVSAQMLMRPIDRIERPWNEQNQNLHAQCEADIWEGMGEMAPHGDRVTEKLNAFRHGLVNLCRPVVDREFGRLGSSRWPIKHLLSRNKSGP